jgi:hypothetical protein
MLPMRGYQMSWLMCFAAGIVVGIAWDRWLRYRRIMARLDDAERRIQQRKRDALGR